VQTGYIYHYALAMIVGIFILISYFSTWPMIKELLSK
jgi:NADH-quinone oxidoreductase subunit L